MGEHSMDSPYEQVKVSKALRHLILTWLNSKILSQTDSSEPTANVLFFLMAAWL